MEKKRKKKTFQNRRKTNLFSTPANPLLSITIVNATSNLQLPGPSLESTRRCIIVARPEHNDMCPMKLVVPVQLGIVRGGFLRDIVGLEVWVVKGIC